MNFSKKFGDMWVYAPLPCSTGALHAQPHDEEVRIEACCEFTSDFKVLFDDRGALDAPILLPRGGVRAMDFESGTGRILIAHERRDGWWA